MVVDNYSSNFAEFTQAINANGADGPGTSKPTVHVINRDWVFRFRYNRTTGLCSSAVQSALLCRCPTSQPTRSLNVGPKYTDLLERPTRDRHERRLNSCGYRPVSKKTSVNEWNRQGRSSVSKRTRVQGLGFLEELLLQNCTISPHLPLLCVFPLLPFPSFFPQLFSPHLSLLHLSFLYAFPRYPSSSTLSLPSLPYNIPLLPYPFLGAHFDLNPASKCSYGMAQKLGQYFVRLNFAKY